MQNFQSGGDSVAHVRNAVFAQAAFQEPRAFAFHYPNNDVLNGGRPTPAARQSELFGSDGLAIPSPRTERSQARLRVN